MRKSEQIILGFLLVALALTSCGTSTRSVSSVGDGQLSKQQFIQAYKAMKEYPLINARGTLSLYVDDGAKELNLPNIGMRWYLERDKGLEVSVRPISFVEVGRLSVARNEVLLIDRMNKLYYHQRDARRSIGSLITFAGMDPMMAVAAIQHRPFGFVESGVSALERMRFSREKGGYTFKDELRPGGNSISHYFDAGLNLVSTSVVLPGKGEALISYSDFVRVGERKEMRPIPTAIQIEAKSSEPSGKHIMVHFALEKVEVEKQQEISTTPQADYRSVTLEDIINILRKL